MELVTVTNRTHKNLEAMWDGRVHVLPPGDSSLPRIVAEVAKRQNPIMGTENPQTGESQCLLGVKEWGDDTSPIEQTNELERWDRKKLTGARPTTVVPGAGGIYSARDVQAGLPIDSTFVKP